MNLRYITLLALCGLLMGQASVESRQLLPLPQALPVQQAASDEVPVGAGEIQFLQPNITLLAESASADRIDKDAPPIQVEIPIIGEVVSSNVTAQPPPISAPKVKTPMDTKLDEAMGKKEILMKKLEVVTEKTMNIPIVNNSGVVIGKAKVLQESTGDNIGTREHYQPEVQQPLVKSSAGPSPRIGLFSTYAIITMTLLFGLSY